jgi:hypothetical protein
MGSDGNNGHGALDDSPRFEVARLGQVARFRRQLRRTDAPQHE